MSLLTLSELPYVPPSFEFVTLRDQHNHVDLQALGVRCVEVDGPPSEDGKPPKFDAQGVRKAILEVLKQVDAAE